MKQKIKEQKRKYRANKVKLKLRKKRELIREEKRTEYELIKLQLENQEKLEPIRNEKKSRKSSEYIT